jgi:branched-chain amino acid aminotransferase
MKIKVEESYTRAAPGGAGYSKNAGNYGGSMLAATLAKKQGYDQVLWTDAFEHRWLQEVGMMNVFFVINNIAITPGRCDPRQRNKGSPGIRCNGGGEEDQY